MMAKALFSCSDAQAVLPSADTAMYSGSRSWAAVAFGPKTRTPFFSSSALSKALKSAVRTTGLAGSRTSTTLIEPSGSIW